MATDHSCSGFQPALCSHFSKVYCMINLSPPALCEINESKCFLGEREMVNDPLKFLSIKSFQPKKKELNGNQHSTFMFRRNYVVTIYQFTTRLLAFLLSQEKP